MVIYKPKEGEVLNFEERLQKSRINRVQALHLFNAIDDILAVAYAKGVFL